MLGKVARRTWLACILLPVAVLVGCLPTTEDGLTGGQRAAVDEVMTAYTPIMRIFAALQPLPGALAAVEAGAALPGEACPQLSAVTIGQTATVTLDYGAGCSTPQAGGVTVAGRFVYTVNLTTRSGTVTLENVQIAGQSVSGTLLVSYDLTDNPQPLLATSIDVALAGGGRVVGVLTYELPANGVLRVLAGFWSVDTLPADIELVDPANATTTAVIVDPTDNPDLLPGGGVIAFRFGESGRITLGFDENTPLARQTSVVVDDAPPVAYTLPQVAGLAVTQR